MRIRRIRISGYGPLRSLVMEPQDFDVIFGANEAGKTALVEVLAYLLFRKTAANLRYGKPDDAQIELEEDGQAHTLPAKRAPIDLPGGDVANLMYVQASESAVFFEKGTRFWEGVKSMLSKVDAGIPFTKIDKEIFEAVELQPGREEWTRAKGATIESERQRRQTLHEYMQKTGEIGKKEAELATLTQRSVFLKGQIETIERSKAYKDYEELRKSYNAYTEARSAVQEYERYKDEYLVEWRRLDLERESRLREAGHAKDVEAEIGALEKRRTALEETDRRVAAHSLKDLSKADVRSSGSQSFILPLAVIIAAGLLTALSFVIRALRLPSLVFDGIALALLAYAIYRHYTAKKVSRDSQGLLQKAREVFPDIAGLGELAARIEKNRDDLIETRTSIDEKKTVIGRMASMRTTDAIDADMALLRAKTGLGEIADLEQKLLEKKNRVSELSKLHARLSGLLHENDPNKWPRMIEERKAVPPEREADLSIEKDTIQEKGRVEHRIDVLTREIKVFQAVHMAQAGVTDDHAALVEFHELDQRLLGYELEKEAALKAREILRDMSGELDQFIGGVLQGKDSLSEFIYAVTGTYEKVFVENEDFVAEDKTGARFLLRDLSSGTKDQLLLCFRLAALEKIFPNGAFIILDDAFIFADWQRRERLVGLLRNFIDRGNQVLYLTSDDHTRDLLAKHGARVISLK